MTPEGHVPAAGKWIYGDPQFQELLAAQGLDAPAALSSHSLGDCVTSHRSSWVRRWSDGTNFYYLKTYIYPTWRDRGRGVGRNTVFARSRAMREQQALTWLAEHGFAAPRVRGVFESRRFGVLTRAVLVTDAWPRHDPAPTAEQVLRPADRETRESFLAKLFAFVEQLHHRGFRDRNLDLRNILALEAGAGWEFCKIDSPRFRLVAPGEPNDALAHADWDRLRQSIARLPDPC